MANDKVAGQEVKLRVPHTGTPEYEAMVNRLAKYDDPNNLEYDITDSSTDKWERKACRFFRDLIDAKSDLLASLTREQALRDELEAVRLDKEAQTYRDCPAVYKDIGEGFIPRCLRSEGHPNSHVGIASGVSYFWDVRHGEIVDAMSLQGTSSYEALRAQLEACKRERDEARDTNRRLNRDIGKAQKRAAKVSCYPEFHRAMDWMRRAEKRAEAAEAELAALKGDA